MNFSLFFFSDGGNATHEHKYDMLLRCARYADDNGFHAIWTPERHFKNFGGLYPNPSVLSAALSVITTHLKIRAGSVVLPLHNPIRVAEEWSLVDNLSGGRVGISVASGWHPDDFALAPEVFADRHRTMYERIEVIRRLWRGEKIQIRSEHKRTAEVRIFPNPVQPQLPIWITALGERSFLEAGRIGANVLTGLMDQSIEECARKIASYRRSREANGLDPRSGSVTVMLHTFIGRDVDVVRSLVRKPMIAYLKSFLQASEAQLNADHRLGADIRRLNTDDRDALVEYAFEQYFATRSLMGTVTSCTATVRRLVEIGVNEIACLIDFGLQPDAVLEGLRELSSLRECCAIDASPRSKFS